MNSLVDKMNESRIHSNKYKTNTHYPQTAGDFNSLVTALMLF
jgi:hypothetical protein